MEEDPFGFLRYLELMCVCVCTEETQSSVTSGGLLSHHFDERAQVNVEGKQENRERRLYGDSKDVFSPRSYLLF